VAQALRVFAKSSRSLRLAFFPTLKVRSKEQLTDISSEMEFE
jgi:hypothetical protein